MLKSCINDKTDHGQTALMFAAHNGQSGVVQVLLDAGADINASDNDGWTALIYAARYGRSKIVDLLIAAGADVNAKNNIGETYLVWANVIHIPRWEQKKD